MHYGEIKNCDIANGEGVRVTLFVSGCTNHCEHCFQPQTWDFDYGQPFTSETEQQLLDLLAPSYIQACRINERHTMIAGVRVRDQRELSARSPVKLAGIDDHAAKRRAVAADELRRRVDDNVRAVFDGADEIGRAKGIIDDDGKRMLVRNLCNRVNVGNVAVGIAEGLEVNGLRVGLNGRFDLRKIVCVHKRRRHAEGLERMGEQIIRAAVDGLLADDVVTLLGERFNCIRNRRRAGSNRQGRYAALEGRDALFKDVLCGICEPAIDVARVTKGEAIRRVLRVVEYIGSRRINRDILLVQAD